jgi:hypothetical protein
MEDCRGGRGLGVAVPSFGQLGERFAALRPHVTQQCETVVPVAGARLEREPAHRRHGPELCAGGPVV